MHNTHTLPSKQLTITPITPRTITFLNKAALIEMMRILCHGALSPYRPVSIDSCYSYFMLVSLLLYFFLMFLLNRSVSRAVSLIQRASIKSKNGRKEEEEMSSISLCERRSYAYIYVCMRQCML